MTIQVEVFSILIICILLFVLFFYANRSIKNADPFEKPKGIVLLVSLYAEFIMKLTSDNMGKTAAKKFAPYIGVLALFMFISNISGLFGLNPPTSNYSVTLMLALISFIMIQRTKIISNGIKGYLHGFIEPLPPFIIMNFFGTVAPLISMSLRLFGNITSGAIIMTLVYTFTAWASSFVPILGITNFIGIALAPILHAYFDVFAGLIQTYIFITLTTIFIGNEIPERD